LVTVTIWGALSVPTLCGPNVRFSGEMLIVVVYSSALARMLLEPEPPATSTMPSFSSVAVGAEQGF
jgi:hypothetical protein